MMRKSSPGSAHTQSPRVDGWINFEFDPRSQEYQKFCLALRAAFLQLRVKHMFFFAGKEFCGSNHIHICFFNGEVCLVVARFAHKVGKSSVLKRSPILYRWEHFEFDGNPYWKSEPHACRRSGPYHDYQNGNIPCRFVRELSTLSCPTRNCPQAFPAWRSQGVSASTLTSPYAW